VAEGVELPDKAQLLAKAKRAKTLLDEGLLGSEELNELLGEVAAGSELRAKAWTSTSYNHWQALTDTAGRLKGTLEWANRTEDNKPEHLLHAQIPEYSGAVDDATSNDG
jgi:hypothetical protein